MIEITTLSKTGGPLTKRITLAPDGTLHSDGSACVMSSGMAERATFDSLAAFATCIGSLAPHEAIALGALRDDLPDRVEIATKARLEKLNGAAAPHLIARTAEHISYRPDQPALVLIDTDVKGMPGQVKRKIRELGGFWQALLAVLPELETAGSVFRRSTSAGLSRSDTGERLSGSNGYHTYVLTTDGADAERFLRRLHERCWLHGLGWLMVGAAGQLLDRSLVDRMVYAPERLVFEGAPILDPPLVQDQALRAPEVADGPPIDTRAVYPDLSHVEQAKLRQFRAADAHRLAAAADKARGLYVEQFAKRTGCTVEAARQMVERQYAGTLLPDVVLPFDDKQLDGATVADVLADPDRFVGATLADPLEGVAYGRGKAKVMQRADGTLWIKSFAHGRTTYELKHDAASIEAALRAGVPAEAANTFVRMLLAAELAPDEEQRLRDLVSELSGVKARPLGAKIKAARAEQAKRRARAERDRRAAERTDPRPQITVPLPDGPWLPQMRVLNDVLGVAPDREPPMRDIDGVVTQIRVRRVPSMHALTARGTNDDEPQASRLPAPEQPLLTRLDEAQLGELIEHHIEYTDPTGRPVHLPGPFVKHFLTRHDDALPTVTAVAALPMVLPDGTVLSGQGLNRARGIVFRVPDALEALLPRVEHCTATAVADAMRCLTDEWLCDVAADYGGKCVLVAAGLTILERLMLPERPAFFITAGQRGGGKTTAANMISMAVLGRRASAAAWSPSDEERRKSLLAYYGEGVPLIVWDNIPRGAVISCPSIEKALTAETYSDRVLGFTEYRTVPATGIHLFTGNNIAPRGDLASRSLQARLAVDRPDPENRPFRHPDPVGWTEVKMQLQAQERRQAASHMEARGDRVGPRYELKEAKRLEQEAELVLDPLVHCTGPVTVGNGGETAIGTKAMRPFVDTVRERPDMLMVDASRQRMELADNLNILPLSLDVASTMRAENSLEKMLAHQMAAAHVMAMEKQAEARDLMRRFERSGYVHQHLSIEAGRCMNASARMMDTFQHGLLTLQKLRSGGTQTVVVQHVNVGHGGQAMVAGEVKVRGKRPRRGAPTGERSKSER